MKDVFLLSGGPRSRPGAITGATPTPPSSSSSSSSSTKSLRCIIVIACALAGQVMMHSYTSFGGSHVPIGMALPAFEALSKPTGNVVTAKKQQQQQQQQPPQQQQNVTCQNGGIEVGGGCICGRGTVGAECEDNRVSEEEMMLYQVCGPHCWPSTVWYSTDSFKFRPLAPAGSNEGDDRMRNMLKELLAWKPGGSVRGGVDEVDDLHRDPVMLEIMMSLGPWTTHDKQMLRGIWQFRRDQRAGRGVAQQAPRRPASTTRIVFGLMLHNNLPRFKALWDALFSENHYYIIHVDRGAVKQDTDGIPASREEVIKVIESTPCCSSRNGTTTTSTVWDRVYVLDEDDCFDSMWGDITLVYSEVALWLHLLRRRGWEWDYFINLSGADIPVMTLPEMSSFLSSKSPRSFLYHHVNEEEFRQTYVMGAKRPGASKDELVVFNALQRDFPYGRARQAMGITRLTGNSQWHVLHRELLILMASDPNIHRLLFTYKHTSIPDESFFSTAALWLAKRHPDLVPHIEAVDMRYWNEGFQRDVSRHGELRAIKELADNRQILFARKSNTAIVTCAYTNRLLGLDNDCGAYADTGPYPMDAKAAVLPRIEDPEVVVER